MNNFIITNIFVRKYRKMKFSKLGKKSDLHCGKKFLFFFLQSQNVGKNSGKKTRDRSKSKLNKPKNSKDSVHFEKNVSIIKFLFKFNPFELFYMPKMIIVHLSFISRK
jgi:hypothetical protein